MYASNKTIISQSNYAEKKLMVYYCIYCFSLKAKTLSKPEPVQTGIKFCPQGIPVWTGFNVYISDIHN